MAGSQVVLRQRRHNVRWINYAKIAMNRWIKLVTIFACGIRCKHAMPHAKHKKHRGMIPLRLARDRKHAGGKSIAGSDNMFKESLTRHGSLPLNKTLKRMKIPFGILIPIEQLKRRMLTVPQLIILTCTVVSDAGILVCFAKRRITEIFNRMKNIWIQINTVNQ